MDGREKQISTGQHVPVMLEEVLDGLQIQPEGAYLDATLGGGGHAEKIIAELNDEGVFIGLDRDHEAIARASQKLVNSNARIIVKHANFENIDSVVEQVGQKGLDGVLFDLGVSSFQLDYAYRGFSFSQQGPLDMRMDPSQDLTAADVVNSLGVAELTALLKQYGEEPEASRVAKAIIRKREIKPFETTEELAEVVANAKKRCKGKVHPATLTFMALRIKVNRELECLEKGLASALNHLNMGGRLVVITFHSIEDRMVKSFQKAHAGRRESLQQGGDQWIGEYPPILQINRKVKKPTAIETKSNPRARSAKLRVMERMK